MQLNEIDNLYSDVILEHSRSPRNFTALANADISTSGINPFCGDETHIQIILDKGHRVEVVGLQSIGCSINKATGSMITEAIYGKTVQEIEAISILFRNMMSGYHPSRWEIVELLGDLEALSSVQQFPVRIKCALLAWSALDDGLDKYHLRPFEGNPRYTN